MSFMVKIKALWGVVLCKCIGHDFKRLNFKEKYADITCSRCGVPWRLS